MVHFGSTIDMRPGCSELPVLSLREKKLRRVVSHVQVRCELYNYALSATINKYRFYSYELAAQVVALNDEQESDALLLVIHELHA